MNSVGIVKVNTLQGRAKLMAEADGLEPNDLVILTVSMEKIIGDPVSYLLAHIESPDKKVNGHARLLAKHFGQTLKSEFDIPLLLENLMHNGNITEKEWLRLNDLLLVLDGSRGEEEAIADRMGYADTFSSLVAQIMFRGSETSTRSEK